MENNLTYFQRRASQEKAAALHAAHPRARQVHLNMAQEYRRFVQRLAADDRRFETYAPPQVFAEREAAGPDTGAAALTG